MIDASALLYLVVFVVTLPLFVALTALGIRELFGKPVQPPQAWTRRVVSAYTGSLPRAFGVFERATDLIARSTSRPSKNQPMRAAPCRLSRPARR